MTRSAYLTERCRAFLMATLATGLTASSVAQADASCPGAKLTLNNLYFGDLHVHTGYSMDGYSRGTLASPADAYAFARGATIGLAPLTEEGEPSRFQTIEPGRELDFAAVTDHAEYLGEVALCTDPELVPFSYNSTACVLFRNSGNFGQFRIAFPDRLAEICGSSGQLCNFGQSTLWRDTISAANDSTMPCQFTGFVGYEWSGMEGGGTLHRNVIFRNDQVPSRPHSAFDSGDPQTLRDAIDADCPVGSGCEAIIIPHNTNLSRGRSLALDYPPLAAVEEQIALAEQRERLERLLEVTQRKGTSECHPIFSSDEFCDFEQFNPTRNTCDVNDNVPCQAESNTLRGALKVGLEEYLRLGVNPLKLGAMASTDTHNGNAGEVREVGFIGSHGDEDATPFQRLDRSPRASPGGLMAVWAAQNTRDALFDAMQRRETYGTSGPRIGVRFFAGRNFEEEDCAYPKPALQGYRKGVPMGGELTGQLSQRVTFLVEVLPDEVPIDRVQVIKGYMDSGGDVQETILENAGLRHHVETPTPACEDPTVDCSSLCGVIEDADFDMSRPAFYYLRVLQHESPRWSQADCQFDEATAALPACQPGLFEMPQTIQERAWTSPIWHLPTP